MLPDYFSPTLNTLNILFTLGYAEENTKVKNKYKKATETKNFSLIVFIIVSQAWVLIPKYFLKILSCVIEANPSNHVIDQLVLKNKSRSEKLL